MSFGKYQIVMMNRGKPAATLALASTPSPNLSNCPGLHLSLYLCLCSTPPDHICLSFYLVLCSLTHNTNIRCFSICHQSVGWALFFISPQPEMDLVFVKPPTFATKHRSIFASLPHREVFFSRKSLSRTNVSGQFSKYGFRLNLRGMAWGWRLLVAGEWRIVQRQGLIRTMIHFASNMTFKLQWSLYL